MGLTRRYKIGMSLCLAMGILACYQFTPLFLPKCYEPKTEAQTIILNENFAENWTIANVFLAASRKAIYMVANENHIVLYGKIDARCGSPILINLDTHDGSIIHIGVRRMPSHQGIDNTAYNTDYFYLGYNKPGKAIATSTVASGGVIAYDLDTSEIKWRTIISGTRSIRSLVASDDVISIDGGMFPNYYYLLDSDSGEVISKLDKFTSGLSRSGSETNTAYWYDYVISNPSPAQNADVQNIVFWAERFDKVSQPPVIHNDMLLIRQNEGTSLGKILALNEQHGDVVWETENDVVSNVAVNDSTAFFLTSSAKLFAIDVETGQKIGFVQFAKGDVQLAESRGFFVAANEEDVFVYMGDSRQLFSFRFLPDD